MNIKCLLQFFVMFPDLISVQYNYIHIHVPRRTMSARNRSCSSSILQACSSSSFTRQPSRVLIVDASPPWWSETCTVLCQALEDFFFLASSLAGPVRVPLLSVFAISVQLECLLPFVVRMSMCVLYPCLTRCDTVVHRHYVFNRQIKVSVF